jgi:aspartate/glutamate racemase
VVHPGSSRRLRGVGGIGPESTIEYYRLIIAGYRARGRDGSYSGVAAFDNTRIHAERVVSEAIGSAPAEF